MLSRQRVGLVKTFKTTLTTERFYQEDLKLMPIETNKAMVSLKDVYHKLQIQELRGLELW